MGNQNTRTDVSGVRVCQKGTCFWVTGTRGAAPCSSITNARFMSIARRTAAIMIAGLCRDGHRRGLAASGGDREPGEGLDIPSRKPGKPRRAACPGRAGCFSAKNGDFVPAGAFTGLPVSTGRTSWEESTRHVPPWEHARPMRGRHVRCVRRCYFDELINPIVLPSGSLNHANVPVGILTGPTMVLPPSSVALLSDAWTSSTST